MELEVIFGQFLEQKFIVKMVKKKKKIVVSVDDGTGGGLI